MFIIKNMVNKNKKKISEFIDNNNLSVTIKEREELLESIFLKQEIKCNIIKDEENLKELLCETSVLPDDVRKYFEISGSYIYAFLFMYPSDYVNHISKKSRNYMKNIIVETKVDILVGKEYKKGIVSETKKDILTPIVGKDNICIFLRYDKVYKFGKFPVITNPQLYFYNC